MTTHKWEFAPRFRRNAFGWKSQPPIQRIKEAVAEIKKIARKEPTLAAEGAVLFLCKLSPALEHVDGSSGAIGSAVNHAIESLVLVIAKAEVDFKTRQQWLEKLWSALEDDEIPYIESLGEFWGELCATPEIATQWANQFVPLVQQIWAPSAMGYGFFKGTSACLSSLYAAGRYDDLLSLLSTAKNKWWNDRRWGVKALVTLGRNSEAIYYAEESRGLNAPACDIARACEEILLSSGFEDESYCRYALEANRATTNLATFRAIVKKYPTKSPKTILRDLVASQPGQDGKWFAAAKHAELFDFAIELANKSPGDPRTLIRAAKEYAQTRPDFAISAGIIALRDIANGHGYEITSSDILDAYSAVTEAATSAAVPRVEIDVQITSQISTKSASGDLVRQVLQRQLKV